MKSICMSRMMHNAIEKYPNKPVDHKRNRSAFFSKLCIGLSSRVFKAYCLFCCFLGITPRADDIEVVLSTQADESLLKKADAFAQEVQQNKDPFTFTKLHRSTCGFIGERESNIPAVCLL